VIGPLEAAETGQLYWRAPVVDHLACRAARRSRDGTRRSGMACRLL